MLFAEAKCKLLQSRPWGLPKKTPVKSTDVANQNPHLPHLLILKLPTKEGCNFLYFTFAINRSSPLSVSDRINSTMRSIEVAQKSWIALYDKYADGKLERDFFEREEAV